VQLFSGAGRLLRNAFVTDILTAGLGQGHKNQGELK
jgi:hypothetical protein